MVLDEVFLEINRLSAVELLGDSLGLGVVFAGPRSQMRNQVLFQGPACGVGGGAGGWMLKFEFWLPLR